MRSNNVLINWLAEQGEDKVPEYRKKWYVYYDTVTDEYIAASHEHKNPMFIQLYMTEKTAYKLADLLNKGEIEL